MWLKNGKKVNEVNGILPKRKNENEPSELTIHRLAIIAIIPMIFFSSADTDNDE